MIKRVAGGLLTLVGAFCLYQFTARALFHGRELLGSGYDGGVAFQALGRNYPADILFLLGAGWAFFLGLWLIFTGTDLPSASRGGGRVSKAMLLNALLLVSTLIVLYVGAKTAGTSPGMMTVFTAVALGQAAIGILLLVLSFMERPKGWISLGLGTIVYLAGLGGTAVAFLWGAGGA